VTTLCDALVQHISGVSDLELGALFGMVAEISLLLLQRRQNYCPPRPQLDCHGDVKTQVYKSAEWQKLAAEMKLLTRALQLQTVAADLKVVAYTLMHSLMHSLIHSLMHSLIHSLMHSLIHSLMHSLIHSLIHSLYGS
jgi:hypothetical protein